MRQVPGIDDAQDLSDTQTAMRQLNFSATEEEWVFSLVAGILHLGNVTFVTDGDQGSVVAPDGKAALQQAARLLRVNRDTLATSLCTRSIEVRT
jgi:myosin heavy subunit